MYEHLFEIERKLEFFLINRTDLYPFYVRYRTQGIALGQNLLRESLTKRKFRKKKPFLPFLFREVAYGS